jgi:hypothetical protein
MKHRRHRVATRQMWGQTLVPRRACQAERVAALRVLAIAAENLHYMAPTGVIHVVYALGARESIHDDDMMMKLPTGAGRIIYDGPTGGIVRLRLWV